MNNEYQLRRLQWACRRGMLELDNILLNFLANGYQKLTGEEQKTFSELLACSDPQLFSWFMATSIPSNPSFNALIVKIKANHKPRVKH